MSKKKSEQIQIRISSADKERLLKLAQNEGLSLSAWLIKNALFFPTDFKTICMELNTAKDRSYVLAKLNQFLMAIPETRWNESLSSFPANIDDEDAAYLASMVEQAAKILALPIPQWTKNISPSEDPIFGSETASLRLYLLINAPAPFKQRNIFIDASVGDQV